MPIDPSIALGFQQPKLTSPMDAMQQAMSLKAQMQQSQLRQQEIVQNQQTLKDQQELSALAADRSNIDTATGTFTPEAIAKVSNPNLRQKLNQDRMATIMKSKEIDWKTSEAGKIVDERQTKALHDVFENAYNIYEDTLEKTGNKQVATDAFNKAQAEGYEDLKSTGRGGFSKDTQFRMMSPDDVGAKLISHKERMQIEKEGKTPFIKETEHLEELKGRLADLKPNDPAAAGLRQQIAELQKHINKLDAPPRTTINMGGLGLTKAQESLSGDEFLKTLPVATANQVRAIGEGRMTLQDLGVRGAAREKMASLVAQAYPAYDSGDVKTNRAIEIDFAKGKPAQSLQSINAVTEHMETYRKLAKALDNGDMQLYNKYKNAFEKATGKTLPNDLSAAAPIVGSEIVKAIVPAGGGEREREAAESKWSDAISKKQAESQIDNVYIPLMQGQANSLEKRYASSGKKDFRERFLTPQARKALKMGDDADKASTSTPALSNHDKAAVAWAKANPNDPRASKILELNNDQ